MNNKGIVGGLVIKTLMVLIITLLIFAPACIIGSKLARVSDQAQDSYLEFVKNIEEFEEEAKIGDNDNTILIMDEGTAIVYFNPGAEKVVVDVDASGLNTNYELHLIKPSQCSDDTNCLCLFRKVESDTNYINRVTIQATRVLCNNINYTLQLESCSLGEPHTINSYDCKTGGFFIERNMAKESSWAVGSYYENPRRRQFTLNKKDADTILLKEVKDVE